MKKQNVNLESAKQVVNAKSIIENFANNTKGLLKTSLGTKKASIYKDEIFLDCNEKEKKSLRKKLRNMLFSCASSLLNEKNKENQKALIKAFNDFYKECYLINDYSLNSVCNENLKTEKKEILSNALNLCKKELESK
jgi:hypothetical protein|nr:MAG TPA: hypothetical protein [Caudoviricetes sp.]